MVQNCPNSQKWSKMVILIINSMGWPNTRSNLFLVFLAEVFKWNLFVLGNFHPHSFTIIFLLQVFFHSLQQSIFSYCFFLVLFGLSMKEYSQRCCVLLYKYEQILTPCISLSHYSISGIYFFSKIINYSDLPPLKPASTLVAGVKWVKKFKSSYVSFVVIGSFWNHFGWLLGCKTLLVSLSHFWLARPCFIRLVLGNVLESQETSFSKGFWIVENCWSSL